MTAAESKTLWHPHAGAVSLTFDDGCQSQLDKAIPHMDALGIKGTFFLPPSALDTPGKIAAWKKVAANGHEIGNHSWSHAGWNLVNWSLAQMEADILKAQEMLTGHFPHQKNWSYAYPCYITDVGRGLTCQSYVPVVAKHFVAGRALGENGFGNRPDTMDRHKAWGIPVEHRTGHDLIGIVEDQAAQGFWVVFVFHQIEGTRLSIGGEDLDLLLNHLAKNRTRFLTAPFAQVAAKIAGHQ